MVQLFELLTKKSVVKLLEFFMDNPSKELYEAEIRKRVKISKSSSLKWLRKLAEHDFLLKRTNGMVFYSLNKNNILVKELKRLKMISLLVPEFKNIKGAEVFLYGSAARGEYEEDSDVDILVIGKDESVRNVINVLEKRLGRRIKPSFFTQLEWSKMSRVDPAFFERVERDKVRLS